MKTRIVYAEELSRLKQDVIHMGEKLQQAITRTFAALEERSVPLAKEIIQADDFFDQAEREIEKQCLSLVVKQAPVASDWREIASIMRLIADLERIADHCSDISEYILMLAEKKTIPMPEKFPKMFDAMMKMAGDTIASFVSSDLELARSVVAQDDLVDRCFLEIKEQLCSGMVQSPERVPASMDYLMIAKYVERMADHAANVARWIPFIVNGKLE